MSVFVFAPERVWLLSGTGEGLFVRVVVVVIVERETPLLLCGCHETNAALRNVWNEKRP